MQKQIFFCPEMLAIIQQDRCDKCDYICDVGPDYFMFDDENDSEIELEEKINYLVEQYYDEDHHYRKKPTYVDVINYDTEL